MSYFGTDGIRGVFGQFPITPEFLLRLGFVAGKVLIRHHGDTNYRPSVLIGKDTRLSGYVVEASLQAGFNAAGVDVYMLGVIPTPAIAHLVRSFHADMGVVISASHNPYQDNGVKFFSASGKKISEKMQHDINKMLDELVVDGGVLPLIGEIDCAGLGKNHRIDDANGRYIEFCKGSFPYQYHLHGRTMVLDCANGAGYSVAPRVFHELGAAVITLGNQPNGININQDCGSTHPKALQESVVAHKADFGLALDGDGDRIIMVDEQGRLVDGDAILYILAMHGEQKPVGVVGTLMSNMALEVALKQADIDFVRAKVGDRYVMQVLEEKGWVLGGESSGHILTLDKAGTGDAIVAGLQVLAIVAKTGKRLSELLVGYQPMPQCLVNVRLAKKQDPYQFSELVTHFEQASDELGHTGRLLIRQSGTEALIRVMVESVDEALATKLAHQLADEIARVMA